MKKNYLYIRHISYILYFKIFTAELIYTSSITRVKKIFEKKNLQQ